MMDTTKHSLNKFTNMSEIRNPKYDRIYQLKAMRKEQPNDPFIIYALGNEYMHTDAEVALTYFEILLNEHPNYTATYYHAAHIYMELMQKEKARATFLKGLEVCQQAGDQHALRELKTAYQNFLIEMDEL